MLKLLKSGSFVPLILLITPMLTSGCGAVLSSNPRSVLMETGEDYLASGDYDKAVRTFDAILTDEPKNVKALTGLGVAYYEQGQYDKALEKFTRAKELDPDDEKARLYLGLTYLKKGDDEKALAEWREYTELISTGKFTDLIRRGMAMLNKEGITSEEREFVLTSIEYATQQERKVLAQEGRSSYTLRSSSPSSLSYTPSGLYNYYYTGPLQPLPPTIIVVPANTAPVRGGVRQGIETRIQNLRRQ